MGSGVRLPEIKISFVWVILVAGILCLLGIAFYLLKTKGNIHPRAPQRYVSDVDLEQGRNALRRYSCGSCHEIPGLAHADGRVGPSLKGIRQQMFIAGELPNNAENLADWIRKPKPESAMPDLGVTQEDARQITGYLYKIEDESILTWLRRLR